MRIAFQIVPKNPDLGAASLTAAVCDCDVVLTIGSGVEETGRGAFTTFGFAGVGVGIVIGGTIFGVSISGVVVAITIAGVEVAMAGVEVAICGVEVAVVVAAPKTIPDPDPELVLGLLNEERSDGHVLPRIAGIAYSVAHCRVCESLACGSTPPSVC